MPNFHCFYLVAVLAALFLFQSCNITRNVPEQRQLLNKVRVEVNDPLLTSDLYSLVRQKENNRILLVYRFKLRFYSFFIWGKDNESGFRNKVGEPPVIYDSVSAKNTVNILSDYLKNKGYYRNVVEYEEHILHRNRKKIRLTYHVKTGQPTTIAGIDADIKDLSIVDHLIQNRKRSLLRKGDNFDIDKIDEERSRITQLLKEKSYFFFSEDLIYFSADTNREKGKVYLTIKLKEDPIKFFNDTTRVDPYKTYQIHNVYVEQLLGDNIQVDSKDTTSVLGYRFLNGGAFSIRPKVLTRSIFVNPNDYYTLTRHELTFRRLSSLSNYKYINITYNQSTERDSLYFLDCRIKVSPNNPQSISLEPNLTNTGGNLGINGALSYQHRNIFHGAEALRLRLYAGIEAQAVHTDNGEQQQQAINTTFNTKEIGPELSITFPKFLLPFDQENFAKRYVPKTTTSLSYNFQQRPDYTRTILNTTLNYWFKESETKSHSIQPLSLSQVKINKSQSFQNRLDSVGNRALTASYEDNFITSVMYSFVFNNQVVKSGASYQIFRASVEFAGNLLGVMSKNLWKADKNDNGQYLFNGIPYAQYFRTYLEYIHNFRLNERSNLVARTFGGVGIPYGNSFSMPFVKSFYSGGTNGIRAWKARRIGPGSVPDSIIKHANVDQIGDVKLELNLEYRFKIISVLEGAIFTDMGNIWVLDNPDYSAEAQFKPDKILHDLAIGAGAGARLNFDFFIMRLDAGWRIKDPAADDPTAIKLYKNVDPNTGETNYLPVINFAIGYPF